MVRAENVRLYEVGISYYARTYDEGKKIGWKDGMRALWCIFKYNTSTFSHLTKYLINGVIIASTQFLIVYLLVQYFSFDNEYLKNIANIISVISGLLIAFILHSKITWKYKFKSKVDILKKIGVFYSVSFVSIILRIFVFYYFNKIGMDYKLNVAIGIILVVAINFFGYDKFVFNKLEINK